MALLDCEGFGFSTNSADYVTYGLFTAPAGGSPPIATGGPLGDNYSAGSSYRWVRTLPASATAWFFGMRMLGYHGFGGSDGVTFITAAGSTQFTLRISNTGMITVFDSGNQAVLSSAAGVVPVAAWCYLEVGAVIGNPSTVTIKVNGTVVLSSTAITNTGTSPTGGFVIGSAAVGVSTPAATHIYFCDNTGPAPWNTYLGDVRVQTLMPTANDAVAFTPNGNASNWQNAAEDPPVPATDYNSSSTAGAQDTFDVAAMDPTLPTVFGVQVKVIAEKTDTGARTFNTVLKSGSATATGTPAGMNTSPTMTRTMFQTDPATGAQWTNAGVNAAKPGYVIAS